jgi:hypothetical protein
MTPLSVIIKAIVESMVNNCAKNFAGKSNYQLFVAGFQIFIMADDYQAEQ